MNPILIDMPERLETERLVLRAPLPSGDGKIVNQAVKDSYSELNPWLPFAQHIPSVDETEANLRSAYIKFVKRESFRFLIFHKESNEFIGTVSYQYVDWDVPKCELGYWIDTKYSGSGYITEAVKKLVEFGNQHLEFKRIVILCESENKKSRAVPERLGFEMEGILRNDDLSADGTKLTDTCVYSFVY